MNNDKNIETKLAGGNTLAAAVSVEINEGSGGAFVPGVDIFGAEAGEAPGWTITVAVTMVKDSSVI